MLYYSDFWEIVNTYNEKKNHDFFSHKRVACIALDYWEMFKQSKRNQRAAALILYLLSVMEGEKIEDYKYYINAIREELKMYGCANFE